MQHLNVEIKAICSDAAVIREYLLSHQALYVGTDEQTDTYFHVTNGRLKLREGKIENNLIYYVRPDQPGPKDSHFHLVKVEDAEVLKTVLTASLGVLIIVKKIREIYYIDNVKFHLDMVPGLGSFVEIEAGNIQADLTQEQLKKQCQHYMKDFGISDGDLVEGSYSDMLLKEMK